MIYYHPQTGFLADDNPVDRKNAKMLEELWKAMLLYCDSHEDDTEIPWLNGNDEREFVMKAVETAIGNVQRPETPVWPGESK